MASFLKSIGDTLTNPGFLIPAAATVASGGTLSPWLLASAGLSTVSDYERQRQQEKFSRRQRDAQRFANLQQAISPRGERFQPAYSVPKLSLLGRVADLGTTGIGAYRGFQQAQAAAERQKVQDEINKERLDQLKANTPENIARKKILTISPTDLVGDATSLEQIYVPRQVTEEIFWGGGPSGGEGDSRTYIDQISLDEMNQIGEAIGADTSGFMRGIGRGVSKNIADQEAARRKAEKEELELAKLRSEFGDIEAKKRGKLSLEQAYEFIDQITTSPTVPQEGDDFSFTYLDIETPDELYNHPILGKIFIEQPDSVKGLIASRYFKQAGEAKERIAKRQKEIENKLKVEQEKADRRNAMIEEIRNSRNPGGLLENYSKALSSDERQRILVDPRVSRRLATELSYEPMTDEFEDRLLAGHTLQGQLALYEANFLAAERKGLIGLTNLSRLVPNTDAWVEDQNLNAIRKTLSSAVRDAAEKGVMTEEDRKIWLDSIPDPGSLLRKSLPKFDMLNDMLKMSMIQTAAAGHRENYNISAYFDVNDGVVGGIKGMETYLAVGQLNMLEKSLETLNRAGYEGHARSLNYLIDKDLPIPVNPDLTEEQGRILRESDESGERIWGRHLYDMEEEIRQAGIAYRTLGTKISPEIREKMAFLKSLRWTYSWDR